MILYEGPSLLDGKPIVVIATTKRSRNAKTGDMLQTWILRQDIAPHDANRLGEDGSVCGSCPLKGIANPNKSSGLADNRGCYVRIAQAPLSVFKSYHRGIYDRAETAEDIAKVGAGRMVRIGSYGDGAAAPAWIWRALVSQAKGHTAYSHQSGADCSSFDPSLYMVSADDEETARDAWSRGRRTFRVVKSTAALVKGREVLCPASAEAGKRTTCASCGLCAGASIKAKSIAIVAHGNGAKHVA